MLRRVKFHTGPTIVKQVCKLAVDAGYEDAVAGTEHVYVNLEDALDGWGVMRSVDEFNQKIGINLGNPVDIRGI